MAEMFRALDGFALELAWQASLFLALGLAASAAWARRPARAHRALLLAMAAGFVAPTLGLAVRSLGWGLLRTRSSVAVRFADERPAPSPAPAPSARPSIALPPSPLSGSNDVKLPTVVPVAGREEGLRPAETARISPSEWSGASWPALAVRAWAVLSGLAALRLASSLVLGCRVVRRARPLDDEAVKMTARLAVGRLGLRAAPEIYESDRVQCPVIWCWGSRPRLLLPDRIRLEGSPVDWAGIFCHELAHWKRRDHVAAFLAELTVCALPWNPLAWWAKARLGQSSEMACDDWVLAGGGSAADYAESLLALVPQRRPALALAAVTSRSGLVDRIRHILDERRSSPVVGTGWTALATLAAIGATSAIALAQAGPAAADRPVPANVATTGGDTPKESAMKRTAKGLLLGPDGSPEEGARVLWVGRPKPPLSFVALPKSEHISDPERRLAEGKTDAQGRFQLEADFDIESFYGTWLVILAPRAAILTYHGRTNEGDLNLKLTEETPVEGRILTPGGTPAAGVRVSLDGVMAGDSEGTFVGRNKRVEDLPDYWPRPQVTDKDGRFTMKGIGKGLSGTLSLAHPDYAVDEVTVAPGMEITAGMKAFEIVPVGATFTHTLEPARPVQGVVTDKETGKPLANILVEMTPMRRHGGMSFTTRTDAQGRYRVSGHQADTYITTVSPPADAGYLTVHDRHQGWPAGAKSLEKNFALEKGKLLRGTVVDAASKAPIAGASIVYQPRRGNPHNQNQYDLRSPVLCDERGRFTITGLPGPGVLVVEAPLSDAIRVPLPERDDEKGRTWYPHGFAKIDVPEEDDLGPVVIRVRRGTTLRARVVGPDGGSLPMVVAYCPELNASQIHSWSNGKELDGGNFQLPGADPDRTYRVYFLHPKLKLGKIAELKSNREEDAAIEVRLEKTASVHGRLLNIDGSPVRAASAYPMIVFSDKAGELGPDGFLTNGVADFYVNLMGQTHHMEYETQNGSVNDKGEFRVTTLIPGARFYLRGESGRKSVSHPIPVLSPGEDRDLGAIVMKERQP